MSEQIDVTIKTGVAPYTDGSGHRIDVEIKAIGSSIRISLNDMEFEADYWMELRSAIDGSLQRITAIRQPKDKQP